jgi:DNA-directed RNA polymerase specialized sigma subunit
MLNVGPTWEDSPPKPQRKNIRAFRGGLAPFQIIGRPDEAQEKRLVERAKSDIIARNMLIAGHLWVAEKVANRFRRWLDDDSEFDDLQQEAALALFRAVDQLDPKSRNRFSTFAWAVVTNDVMDWLRKQGKLKRHASTELIAEKNENAFGLYASKPRKSGAEYEIFCELFGKT